MIDLTEPLPSSGVFTIKASAGTGKTFSLTRLAIRYLIEGPKNRPPLKPSELLLVTFSNDAANEIRHRVRKELTSLKQQLAELSEMPLSKAELEHTGKGDDPSQELLTHFLTAIGPSELERRVIDAIESLDEAVISTIHSFCNQVVHSAGVGDLTTAVLETSVDEILESAVSDALISQSLEHLQLDPDSRGPLAEPKKINDGLSVVLSRPGIRIEPTEDTSKTEPKPKKVELLTEALVNATLLTDLKQQVPQYLASAGVLGFDELIGHALKLIKTSDALLQVMQERFSVVMVDEFQDTDQRQWDLLSTIAGYSDQQNNTGLSKTQCERPTGEHECVLLTVGDPKQAIYGFRGGNTHVYNRAISRVEHPETIGVNYRSSARMIAALNWLFEDAIFGKSNLYEPVNWPEHKTDELLANLSSQAGGCTREADRNTSVPALTIHPSKEAQGLDDVDLPAYDDFEAMVRYINWLRSKKPDLRFKDIAVLTRSNTDAAKARDVLRRFGLPAVLARSQSVVDSECFVWWKILVSALERPHDIARLKRLALTPFFGFSPIEALEDHVVRDLNHTVNTLRETLLKSGVGAMSSAFLHEFDAAKRLIKTDDGARNLVDFEHIAELLQRSTISKTAEPRDLAAILKRNFDEGDETSQSDLLKQRIETETDEDVIKIMTFHSSKGLEFEVVCCPTVYRTLGSSFKTIFVEGDDGDESHVFDLRSSGSGFASGDDSRDRAKKEELLEYRRFIYVALTRAKSHLAIWAKKFKVPESKEGLFINTKLDPLQGLVQHKIKELFTTEATDGSIAETQLEDLIRCSQQLRKLEPAEKARLSFTDFVQVKTEPYAERYTKALVLSSTSQNTADATAPADLSPSDALGESSPAVGFAKLGRQLDRSVSRHSFSSITQTAFPYEQRQSHKSNPDLVDDGPLVDERLDTANEHEGLTTSSHSTPTELIPNDNTDHESDPVLVPLAVMPSGTQAGSTLHKIFEDLDFVAERDSQQKWLSTTLEKHFSELSLFELDTAKKAILSSIGLGLGASVDELALNQIERANRLDEMEFDLSLRPQDQQPTTLRRLGQVVLENLHQDDEHFELLNQWANSLLTAKDDPALGGYMTGSIDLYFRYQLSGDQQADAPGASLPNENSDNSQLADANEFRYVIADYKSNRIAKSDEPMTDEVFSAERVGEEMLHGQYLLQALIYCLAMNRHLQMCIANYNPQLHRGPALYLFVRGMTGAKNPDDSPHGVFSWRPSQQLIEAVDELFCKRNGIK